jgi:AcrR family transcriptional regulator
VSKNEKRLDPRVIRTRQMLREAFMALIPEMGYETITVQHITDRATLNRATFYLHYRDKQDLLTHIIRGVVDELEALPLNPADSVGLRRIFVSLFDHVAKNAAFYRVLLQEPSVAPYVHQIDEHIQAIALRALTAGSVPPEEMLTPPDLFVAFIGWAYLGVIRWWVLNGMAYSSEYMALQFMRLTMSGLRREFELGDMMLPLEEELRGAKVLTSSP